jgi:hypothetical protein
LQQTDVCHQDRLDGGSRFYVSIDILLISFHVHLLRFKIRDTVDRLTKALDHVKASRIHHLVVLAPTFSHQYSNSAVSSAFESRAHPSLSHQIILHDLLRHIALLCNVFNTSSQEQVTPHLSTFICRNTMWFSRTWTLMLGRTF